MEVRVKFCLRLIYINNFWSIFYIISSVPNTNVSVTFCVSFFNHFLTYMYEWRRDLSRKTRKPCNFHTYGQFHSRTSFEKKEKFQSVSACGRLVGQLVGLFVGPHQGLVSSSYAIVTSSAFSSWPLKKLIVFGKVSGQDNSSFMLAHPAMPYRRYDAMHTTLHAYAMNHL